MIRCYNTGAVTGRDRVGGLVGVMGGIFGNSTARRCFSIADVRGEAGVGGLVGDSIGVIEDCYAIARVTGEQDVGGLLGFNGSSGVVSKCFSASHVSGAQNVKGLVGSNEQGNITASFWDIESSGLPGRPTEGAKTTTQMQQASTFLEAGWDFVDETENGVLNIWWIEEGRDYPRFWWHSGRTPYSGGGTGEPNDPYQIATAEDLTLLGETPGDYHKHFILTADIDLDPNLPGGKIFDTAVIAPDWTLTTMSGFQGRPFTGVFDGNGHKISHITIDDASCLGYLGLFGQLGPGAEVSNLGLEAVAINGAGDYIGGFAGESDGRIASSYCTGTISGTGSYVGGLVGSNRGYITASYSTCTISGRWHVGGLASENDGRIATSYSTGTISGWTHVGGLIGSDGGTISSFWDIETSGQTTSDGGTGKTTAEMQTATTFLEAGWDFMDETENGTDDIWWIVEGQDYPRLWWEEVLVLMVDDFESYTDDIDAGEAIFETWVVYGDHVAHVGHLLPPFAEQTIVHGGSQSMPFYYDNTGGVVNSRAERWWGPARDWTIDDADALTLYFRGEADNDPEPLYVAIEDDAGQIAVVTHPGADAVQATEWQKWHIPLAELQAAGVDVAAVEKMIIGVGEREKLQPGGEGLLYIDDILLTNRMR